MKGVYPFGPLIEGAGLNITVLSNMGHVDFGVIACRELVPDVWDIADGFGEAVLELHKLAEDAARPAPSRSRRAEEACPGEEGGGTATDPELPFGARRGAN